MLSPKSKALLKRLANPLKPSLSLGKGPIDDRLVEALDKALKAHELVKVRVLASVAANKNELAGEIARKSASELVAVIGRVAILYKPRKENPSIVL
ncbi:MAG: YhbY family RNA-binding protein [Bacilli bacterium]|jgi:RNA-binding protein|nr:YhbY family RNA-binding protein [Bacilli bacterium]MCI2111289.1 YhbY family RNA-binding protein [Bacilli bacterium]